MKKFFVITMMLWTACIKKEKLHDFIPGTYVKHITGEYSEGYDTLLINETNEDANTYVIIRNASYQRMINGKIKPPEHKTEKWIAVYDEKNTLLVEQKKGKMISFVPEKNQLLVGSSVYQKIK